MRYRTFTEKSSLFRILGEIGILLSRSGKKLISHLSLPQAMNTLCCMQRCVSWCSTRDVACPRGVVGTRSPHACPVLPQVVSRRGHATCFRHCMPGKTMWVPPAPGAWQALLWDGDPEWWTGVPCVRSGNKAPGPQIHTTWGGFAGFWEVLSAGEGTGFAKLWGTEQC